MKRAFIPLSVLATALLVVVSVVEIGHLRKFGHLLMFGLHTDVILRNSDVATDDAYFARLWNLSITPIEIEGCFQPNDVVGAPPSVLFRWDIQK